MPRRKHKARKVHRGPSNQATLKALAYLRPDDFRLKRQPWQRGSVVHRDAN